MTLKPFPLPENPEPTHSTVVSTTLACGHILLDWSTRFKSDAYKKKRSVAESGTDTTQYLRPLKICLSGTTHTTTSEQIVCTFHSTYMPFCFNILRLVAESIILNVEFVIRISGFDRLPGIEVRTRPRVVCRPIIRVQRSVGRV